MALQQDARLVPVALCSALGDAHEARNLREREAAEELQIDDLCEVRLDLPESRERLPDAFKVPPPAGRAGAPRSAAR